jgi:hypothetical protein
MMGWKLVAVMAVVASGCRDQGSKEGGAKPASDPPVREMVDAAQAAPPAPDPGVAGGMEEAALRVRARDCNASAWKTTASRPLDGTRAAWLDRASAVVEEDESKYELVARRPARPDPDRVVCWKERGPRSKLTLDRLDRQPVDILHCSFGGETRAFAELDAADDVKNSEKPPGSCYAACGAGCKGVCLDVAVGCAPPAGGAATSPAFACIALVDPPNKVPKFPWFKTHDGPRCVDPKRHANRTAAACTATVNRFAPDGLVATSGSVKLCSAAECCGHHDECTGAHTNPFSAAFIKCHWYGERKCGSTWAIVGRPDNTDWTIRVYNTKGQPVTGREVWMGAPIQVGECSWTDGKPTWKPPAPQMESYTCAVDGIEH